MELRLVLRRLWADHVLWTRVVIMSALAGLADTQNAIDRLMRNQQEIGDAMKPVLGIATGDHLAALLREHIRAAIDAVVALKTGDGLSSAIARLYQNADQITEFLASTRRWPPGGVRALLRQHIDQLLAEAQARAKGDWSSDIRATDASMDHILVLADALAAGLV